MTRCLTWSISRSRSIKRLFYSSLRSIFVHILQYFLFLMKIIFIRYNCIQACNWINLLGPSAVFLGHTVSIYIWSCRKVKMRSNILITQTSQIFHYRFSSLFLLLQSRLKIYDWHRLNFSTILVKCCSAFLIFCTVMLVLLFLKITFKLTSINYNIMVRLSSQPQAVNQWRPYWIHV